MKPLNKMTAEELLEHTKHFEDFKMSGYAAYITALRNKLKEATTPNPDEIHIVWSVEDVYQQAENIEIPITLEQAREVLLRVEDSHDSERGISWGDIEYHLENVLEGR